MRNGSKVSWWTPSTLYLHIHSGVRSVEGGGWGRGGASNSQNNQKLYQHCAPKKKKYIHQLHPIYSLAIPANSISITLKPLSPSPTISHRNIWLYSHYNQTLPAFWVQWSNHIPYIVDKYNQNYSAAGSLLNLFFFICHRNAGCYGMEALLQNQRPVADETVTQVRVEGVSRGGWNRPNG